MKLQWKDRLKLWLVPRLASGLIRTLRRSLRIRHVNVQSLDAMNDAGQRYILAFWHGHLLMMVYTRFVKPITVMISQHRDGEYIASTMGRFGVQSSRGSTTRGGMAAMRDMISLAGSGVNLAITPDGPKGPRRIAQPGVVAAAQLSGLPVVPVVFTAKKKSI